MPITVFGLGTVATRALSEVGVDVGVTWIELHADHGISGLLDYRLARSLSPQFFWKVELHIA